MYHIYALCPSRSFTPFRRSLPTVCRRDEGRKIRRLEKRQIRLSAGEARRADPSSNGHLSLSRMLPFSLLRGGRSCHRVFSGADVRHSHVWVGPSQRVRRRGHLNPRRRKEGGTKERRKEARTVRGSTPEYAKVRERSMSRTRSNRCAEPVNGDAREARL